ncbi:hypothetical protein POM88_046417 [Heracleum sosnowskyi]|uniref:Uncharacterized protein n=1 Tax=Heracleum sosnowskyi TaxID=360622 RepID=A0AAD8H8G7_9APIA|nr:hypothetical protein POM88_046417 [Heracleum sosnowskyi]
MAQGESSNQKLRLVTWAGPCKKKARVNKGKAMRNNRTSVEDRMEGASEGCGDSDEESYVDGSNEMQVCNKTIIYERKSRSSCEGDYPTKPPADAKPTIDLLNNGKGLMAPKPKHTLTHIVRLRWDENTLNTKGAKREAFYSDCIKEFKEYYNYPNNYGEENGDRVVRAHLGRNFKHFLNKEKSRMMKHVNKLLKSGYSKDQIDITTMKPYYFSQRAWNSICDHWGTSQFQKNSINGTKARELVEFTPRSGAKPFDQRRSEIDAEREAKGEMPITDDEFMTFVYDPCDPAVKELQEKMAQIRSSQAELTPELSPTDEPPSPGTQKEIRLKKDLQLTLQVIPPKGGRVFLRPNETLGEIVGAREAAKWAKQTMQLASVDIPDDIFTMMSKILDTVQQMVRSLPTHEVKQSVLDEQVRNLATATFPDPSQQSKQMLYVRTASSLLPQVLKDNDRIIVEETLSEKAKGKKTAVLDNRGHNEREEDPDAHLFPLF